MCNLHYLPHRVIIEVMTEDRNAPDRDARTDAGDEDDAGPRLHGDMLVSALLAFLKSSQAYGYQLTQELVNAGLANFDNGTVYRTLRQLEKIGYVASFSE